MEKNDKYFVNQTPAQMVEFLNLWVRNGCPVIRNPIIIVENEGDVINKDDFAAIKASAIASLGSKTVSLM